MNFKSFILMSFLCASLLMANPVEIPEAEQPSNQTLAEQIWTYFVPPGLVVAAATFWRLRPVAPVHGRVNRLQRSKLGLRIRERGQSLHRFIDRSIDREFPRDGDRVSPRIRNLKSTECGGLMRCFNLKQGEGEFVYHLGEFTSDDISLALRIAEPVGLVQAMVSYPAIQAEIVSELIRRGAFYPDPMLELLRNPADPAYLRSYAEAVNNNYPITFSMLQGAIILHSYEFVKFILSQVSESEWSRTDLTSILETLFEIEDNVMTDLVLRRYPHLVANQGTLDHLRQAVADGRLESANLLLAQGRITINERQGRSLLSQALAGYNLALIRLIGERIGIDYLPLLPLHSLSQPALRHRVFQLAMFSPLREVYQLVRHNSEIAEVLPYNSEIAEVLPSVMERISLAVRFPTEGQRRTVPYMQTLSRDAYVRQSLDYAEGNLNFINNNIGEESRSLTREELRARTVEDRLGRMNFAARQAVGHFYSLIVGSPDQAPANGATGIFSRGSNGEFMQNRRYGHSYRHLMRLIYNSWSGDFEHNYPSLNLPRRLPLSNAIDSYPYFMFNYLFNEDDAQITVPVTAFYPRGFWLHNQYRNGNFSVDQLRLLLSHWNSLHQEIINYRLDHSSRENQKKFFQLVARAYWLNATMCEMGRGTPHNAMMWLNIVYRHHGLPPPIPTLEHFFLDNTALMVPVEWMIENWHSLFEPVFKSS